MTSTTPTATTEQGATDQLGDSPVRPTPLRPRSPDEAVAAITSVLDRTVRALSDEGRPVQANRLAAEAWSALRFLYPEQADRLSRTMHYVARREAELNSKPTK